MRRSVGKLVTLANNGSHFARGLSDVFACVPTNGTSLPLFDANVVNRCTRNGRPDRRIVCLCGGMHRP